MTFYFRKLYNIYIMSNYSLQVDNSRLYDPSLMSAISSLNQRQEEAHRLADAAYGEMSAKANMLEQLANDVQGKDSVAYQNYMNYANALRQHTDMLATQGLNPSTWNNIIKAKNDYSRIISPIENAMKKREEAAKYQAEYIKQHPDAIFEREAGEMGIDQWMKNPNYVPKVIDRRALEERAKERYSALNQQLMEWVSKNGGLDAIKTKDPQAVKKWFKVNVPWLYESMYKTGVNPDDLEKLAAGDPSMQNSLLGAILNDTVRSSGVLSMNTSYDHFTDAQNRQRYQNILDKVMSSVRGASSHSIGETKFDKYDDKISADLLKQSKELAFRAAEAEADRAWKEKMAAKASGGGNGETIGVDDAARQAPTTITGDLDQDKILSIADQLRTIKNGGFENISSENLADAIQDVKKEVGGTIDFNNPEHIEKIKKLAEDKKLEETHWWSSIGNGLAGLGKTWGNLALKMNPIGAITQLIGTLKHNNDIASLYRNSDTGLKYFAESMLGLSGDDLIDASKNYSKAKDYITLTGIKSELKSLKNLYSGDNPLSFTEYMKKAGTTGTLIDPKRAYDLYVKEYQRNKNRIPDLEKSMNNIKVDSNLENAYGTVMKEMKQYGYTKEMQNKGISPDFYALQLADGNNIKWNSYETSVFNETNRKNMSESLHNMLADPKSDYIKLYEYDEKLGTTDKKESTDYNSITGANMFEGKQGQTPVFTTDPRHDDLLLVKFFDKDNKQHTYAIKTKDLAGHPGYTANIKNMIKQNAQMYQYITHPDQIINMSDKEKDSYTKKICEGMDDTQKAECIKQICGAWLCNANPDIKTEAELNNAIKNLTPQEVQYLTVKTGILADVDNVNHDNMNRVVQNTLWGLGESTTTPERARLFERWMNNFSNF